MDVDSDNNAGMDIPQRTPQEGGIEDIRGWENVGKMVPLNSDDNDGDGIEDRLDGFNLDGIPGTGDDENPGERFVPLVIQLSESVDPAVARIQCELVESESTGSVRLWLKNGSQPGNQQPANSGGDTVPAGEYSCGQLGISAPSRTTTLYLEGIALSTDWGDVRITFRVDPDGPGPLGFGHEDSIRVSVFQGSYTVFEVLPYVYEDVNGTQMRTFYHLDHSSPRAFIRSFEAGMAMDDPYGLESGWHGGPGDGFMSANAYGHVFVHLQYYGPGEEIDVYYGKTDNITVAAAFEAVPELQRGMFNWYNFPGRRNDMTELMIWLTNSHCIATSPGAPQTMPLVHSHKWTLTSYPALQRMRDLCEPRTEQNPDGTDYDHFSLDIEIGGGGCGYLLGGVMETINEEYGGFGEEDAWRFSRFWPVVPGLEYGTPLELATQYAERDSTAAWATEEIDGISMRCTFYDVGLIADWIFAQRGDSIHVPTMFR